MSHAGINGMRCAAQDILDASEEIPRNLLMVASVG